MEDRLARFLFAGYDPAMAERRPTASSIAGLAAAVMEINALFIESKVPLRSRLITVYSGSEPASLADTETDISLVRSCHLLAWFGLV